MTRRRSQPRRACSSTAASSRRGAGAATRTAAAFDETDWSRDLGLRSRCLRLFACCSMQRPRRSSRRGSAEEAAQRLAVKGAALSGSPSNEVTPPQVASRSPSLRASARAQSDWRSRALVEALRREVRVAALAREHACAAIHAASFSSMPSNSLLAQRGGRGAEAGGLPGSRRQRRRDPRPAARERVHHLPVLRLRGAAAHRSALRARRGDRARRCRVRRTCRPLPRLPEHARDHPRRALSHRRLLRLASRSTSTRASAARSPSGRNAMAPRACGRTSSSAIARASTACRPSGA